MAERLVIAAREGLGIASLMARKGADPAAIGAVLGVAMPAGPHAATCPGRTVIGTGPGTWLVIAEDAAPDFAEELAGELTGLASVSDQSSGYLVWRLSGAGARTVLQRGAPIDFHPDSFRPGSAASTVVAHVGVIIWQVDDEPTYDMAIFRSYAGSFRHRLEDAAAAL